MGNEEIFLVVKTTRKSTCNGKDSFSFMKESFYIIKNIGETMESASCFAKSK